MKRSNSLPLYHWMVEQFKDEIESYTNWEDLAQKSRRMFLHQAQVLHCKSQQRRPPFDPFAALDLCRIHKVTWIEQGKEAQLLPDDKGFHLVLRKPKGESTVEQPEENTRIRTTVAHEIGHTFFFDTRTSPPQSGPKKFGFEGIRNSKARKKEEQWCNDFARSFLLPTPHVKKFLGSKTVNLNLVLKIRTVFKVSWDILVRRLLYDFKVGENYTIFRFQYTKFKIIIRNPDKDVWHGHHSKFKDLGNWLAKNERFLLCCLNVGNNSLLGVKKCANLTEKYVVEFLEIYPKSRTFLCLVKEADKALEGFVI